MIKNIIFDFGNVIMKFNIDELTSKYANNKEEKEFLINEVINSPEWAGYGLIDTGFLSYDDAITTINDRTNHKYDELVTRFMLDVRNCRELNGDILDVLDKLKKKGYNIYLLSNTSDIMFNRFRSDLEKIFDGLVLSYEIHMIKPYESIYKYLLKEYNLNVEESLFVDDKEANVNTANSLGIKGRRVLSDNVDDIKAMLNEYGIVLDK